MDLVASLSPEAAGWESGPLTENINALYLYKLCQWVTSDPPFFALESDNSGQPLAVTKRQLDCSCETPVNGTTSSGDFDFIKLFVKRTIRKDEWMAKMFPRTTNGKNPPPPLK